MIQFLSCLIKRMFTIQKKKNRESFAKKQTQREIQQGIQLLVLSFTKKMLNSKLLRFCQSFYRMHRGEA